MIKYNKLKQGLVKEAAIAAAAIFVLGGVAIGLSSFSTSSEEELQAATSNLQSTSAQIADLETKKSIVSKSGKKFKELKERIDNEEFTLDPLNAQERLNALRKDFRLGEPKVQFTQEADLVTPAFQKHPSVIVSKRDVTFEFKAMTDMHVYSFLNAIETSFPGMVKIKKVQLARLSEVNDQIIKQIQLGDEPELISATIEFVWIGLRFKDDPNASTGDNPNGI